ncbi:MAG TPA: sigma-70 family RNA polymerase sigma factor [Vicinamibacteria bacterium]|nr:sigma-70 family RNA polymerase sigma factor [Vicinamibacteria bacterium]
MRTTQNLTGLLIAWSDGDQDAFDQLITLAYGELRRQARLFLRREKVGHTLQPTALVHEAFLRLAGQNRVRWQNRQQFFAVAAQAMRRVLVDWARARGSVKRGEGRTRVTLEENHLPSAAASVDVESLDRALDALAALDPRQARLVELRYFGGLTATEAAQILGISLATAKRDWAVARAWLFRELAGPQRAGVRAAEVCRS